VNGVLDPVAFSVDESDEITNGVLLRFSIFSVYNQVFAGATWPVHPTKTTPAVGTGFGENVNRSTEDWLGALGLLQVATSKASINIGAKRSFMTVPPGRASSVRK